MKQWIQIWYSWGDQEEPVEVPDGADPWEYMKKLAVDEAAISFYEHEDEGEMGLSFYVDEGKIILHYHYDDKYCYYLITDTEEYDPDDEEYEEDEEYVPSSTNGDYSPGNPWDAPGMSPSDFI